ncbi:MAG TPA: colanic acid biosynthesis glycosyltransferase WcaL, partial [Bacteroidetes bacterium]|nr:colanic acid biosynthesis glycosyltransferase WcaL [Bacteroidota bacterium]
MRGVALALPHKGIGVDEQRFMNRQKPHILFLVNRLYEWSQNFITRELTELNNLGRLMTIGARHLLERTDLSEEEKKLKEKYFPIRENPFTPEYLFNHFVIAFSRPARYFKTWAVFFSLKHKMAKWPRGVVCLFRAAGIAREVEKKGINLIHAHFLTAPGETALYLSLLTGIPFGGTAYAMDIYVDNSGLKGKLKYASYINGTTRYNERSLAALLSKNKEKALTLYYGIPVAKKLLPPIPHEGFVFLAVGRLVQKKGFEYLIEACRILKEKGFDFYCEIIGKGPLEKSLNDQINKSGLSQHVSLTGYVAPNEMARKYRSGDVLVAPCIIADNGDVDGLPNVCLEAMNYGLPVISTTISGIPEAVEEGVNGWLVPPNDSLALAGAMARALQSAHLPEMRKA